MVGSAEQRQQSEVACAVFDRRQQVCDLGTHRGADRRRVRVEARRELPESADRGKRWLRSGRVACCPFPPPGMVPAPPGARPPPRPPDPPRPPPPPGRREPL